MEPCERPDEELTVRPGDQAGWSIPLAGLERCQGLGHELDSTFGYRNGLLVGYCLRCEARMEIPWFRGGTAATLGLAMASEAASLTWPAESVVADLGQVEGLLAEDLSLVQDALSAVRQAKAIVERRRSTQ